MRKNAKKRELRLLDHETKCVIEQGRLEEGALTSQLLEAAKTTLSVAIVGFCCRLDAAFSPHFVV